MTDSSSSRQPRAAFVPIEPSPVMRGCLFGLLLMVALIGVVAVLAATVAG